MTKQETIAAIQSAKKLHILHSSGEKMAFTPRLHGYFYVCNGQICSAEIFAETFKKMSDEKFNEFEVKIC